MLVTVEALAQILAGLEERHELLCHRDGRAGAWIAADARCAVLHREGAETPELHPIAPRQRLDDFVEDDVDDALDVAVVEMLVGRGYLLNELGLDHRSASQPPQSRPKLLYCFIFPNPAKPIPGRQAAICQARSHPQQARLRPHRRGGGRLPQSRGRARPNCPRAWVSSRRPSGLSECCAAPRGT